MKKNLFHILHSAFYLAAAFLFASCFGLEDLLDDTDTTTNFTTTSQSVSFSAEKQQKNVTLSGLKAAINTVDKGSGSSWLTPTPQSYTSGSPVVTIAVAANSATSTRSATVTITDTKQNTVTLTVKQDGISNKIGDVHNNVTDQPAYRPRR